jgi:hypothetical protein
MSTDCDHPWGFDITDRCKYGCGHVQTEEDERAAQKAKEEAARTRAPLSESLAFELDC